MALEFESSKQIQGKKSEYETIGTKSAILSNLALAVALPIILFSENVDENTKTVLSIGGFTAAKLFANGLKNLQLPEGKAKMADFIYVTASSAALGFATLAPFLGENNDFAKSIGGPIALNSAASVLDTAVSVFRGVVDSIIAEEILKKTENSSQEDGAKTIEIKETPDSKISKSERSNAYPLISDVTINNDNTFEL